MELPSIEQVLEKIDAFVERHGMSPTRFGAEATGDQNLVSALRGGASPSLKRLHRIADYMRRKDEEREHGLRNAGSASLASPGNADSLSAQVTA